MTTNKIAEIKARHETRREAWQSYGPLLPIDFGPAIDDTDDLLAALKAAEARERNLKEALEGLVSAVKAHDKANGKIMVDPHEVHNAEIALAETAP